MQKKYNKLNSLIKTFENNKIESDIYDIMNNRR